MALFGAVGEYVEGEEDWSQYVERLGHFFGANGVSDASKKRSVLLSTIGPKAYQTLASLVAPETPGGKTYDELIKLMAEHFSPKPPVIVQRYRFHSRVRQQGESVSVYVTQLKELARKCEFGDALNDMLRDRLVCGINDERVQKRLLVEVNLTFDSALKISQGCEVAERCAKEIHSGRSQELAEHQNQQVHAVTPGPPQWRTGPGTGTPRCYRCLRRDHAPDKCPHRSAECFGCGKRGHIRRACKQVQAKAGGMQPSRRGVQVLQEESEDLKEEGDSTNALQQLRIQGVLCKINNEPIQLQVSIDGVLVTMELDTGAAVSIVSESTFRRLWSGKVLERSGIRLCTYSGESLKVIGKWEADVKYNNQTDKLSVIVLEGAGPSLLGRDWLHRFRIDWKSLFVIQKGASLENVLTKYEMVFNEGLARPMPYAIKEKIEKELNKLVQEGILQPVELSEWAAPIVPVVKPDQSIRICGDFRLTVNQALETERYPLPKIEDILASLAEKVEAVKNAPEPKNITELKSYLGLLTYYSRFLPRMATMLAQLYRLLQAKIPWNWTQKEKMAFENKEEFATVCQDHKPLLQLFDPQRGIPMQVSGRIQRWIMTLAVYKYKLVFKKTEEHGNADALSRLPMDGKQIEEEEEIPTELVLLFESLKDSPVDCSQVKHWTKKDPILSQVLQYILAGWPLHPPSGASQTLLSFWQRRMELSTHDGCILWGNRVVVPEKGRNYVLQELHGGHPGISRMKSLSRTFVWWPGIDKDIEMLVSKCPQCQAARPSPPVAPLQPWSWPTRPWARLHIDYAGPVEGQMLLVVIDAHSKWIEVEVGKDATAEATIQQLRTIFSRMAERAVQTVKQGVKKMTTGTLRDKRHQDQLRKRTGEADDTWMGDRLSTDVAAEDPELNNGAEDEQEEDANNSVVGDEHEIDEEIDQEARPPVIVQQAPDRRYPSRNRRQPERYQAGFS
ncbi:hypothetical protein EMCRGX_G012087 [Ephydatia muelleri]